jgi:S1-C subfamily serine protease
MGTGKSRGRILGISVAILGIVAVVTMVALLALATVRAPEETTPDPDEIEAHARAYEIRHAQAEATHDAAAAGRAAGTRQPTATMGYRRAMLQTQFATVAVGLVGEGQTCEPLGSGTVIRPDGLVVTSAHVLTEGNAYCIACARIPGTSPHWCYNAWVIKRDDTLDLALLAIESHPSGSPAGNLSLRVVPLGDSNEVRIGDTVYVFGYPDVGGASLTVTEGLVSGFENNRTLIKTDAEISTGSSGGAAINENGLLIGIPTEVHVQPTGKIGYLIAVNEIRRFLP